MPDKLTLFLKSNYRIIGRKATDVAEFQKSILYLSLKFHISWGLGGMSFRNENWQEVKTTKVKRKLHLVSKCMLNTASNQERALGAEIGLVGCFFLNL